MASSSCAAVLLVLVFSSAIFADETDITTTIVPEDEDVVEDVTEDSRAGEMRDQAVNVQKNVRKDLNPSKNSTHANSEFTPSVHLGPIAPDQQRQPTKLSPFNVGPLLFPDEHKISPFNALSAIKFGDGKEIPSLKPAPTPPKVQKLQQSPFRASEKDVNLVKFIDDKEHSKENCAPSQKISNNHRQSEPIYHQHVDALPHPGYSEEGSYDNGGYQQQYASYETKPTKYDTTSLLYSPAYQQAAIAQPQLDPYHQHHNEAPTIVKPEMIINVQHPMSYQSGSYEKPKTVIYVSHEPHQFYHQPPAVYNHLETMPEHEEIYPIYYDQPQYKSMSPWKKILHIIGAFLPLGLLFALLPSVLRPNANPANSPSIVLSKLRVNDLPEHKRGDRLQLALDTECREERSICRLLAAADAAGFDFLRNLVLRIAEKTAESSVRKKELDRIFEAAKLGNCDILTCDFYDGT